jgi:NADH-quinone oxidoreductase subunit E
VSEVAAPTGFPEETRRSAREIIARYPKPRSALLPMLHLVQSEEGYISSAGIALCAEELGLTKAEVAAVATFYTMFKRRPTGDYLISVCTNTLCAMLGGDEIYAALAEYLGVGHDQTTDDGTITFEHAECLAACDYAPVVTINYEFFDNQTVESAVGLAQELQNGQRPMPTRGAPLCTFREISRQLAGFPDERPDARRAGPAGEPTLIGAALALERGETAPPYPDESEQRARAEENAREPARPPAEPPKPEPAKVEQPKVEPAKVEQPKVEPAKVEQPKPQPPTAEQLKPEPAAQPAAAGTSAHDAPQSTAASDPSADTPPEAEAKVDAAAQSDAPGQTGADEADAAQPPQLPYTTAPRPSAPRTNRARRRRPGGREG